MDQQIISNTLNVLYSFECVFKKEEDGQWNSKDRALRKKFGKNPSLCEKILEHEDQDSAMARASHEGRHAAPHGQRDSVSLEKALVVAVPGFGNEGGYGEIRKVRISRVANILTIVAFAGKMSKAMNEVDKRVERAKEALACPIEHPGLMKFWAINSVTMEAYTLWWNGGSVRSF
jgi:hypothetical protein